MTPLPGTRDHIFVNYRRDDASGASGRLYDWLRIAYRGDRIFRDVHSIGTGKWREKIDAAMARSAACVAVIGPRWANVDNLPRLHDEGDMVRNELLAALASKEVVLVPTLVEGAEVPKLAGLPVELRPLFEVWNARTISECSWEDDTRRLISEISEATGWVAEQDLDSLLRNAAQVQRLIAELERSRHLQTEQVKALQRTADELRAKLAVASSSERPTMAQAFAALSRGDSIAAEDAFEREFEQQARSAAESRRLAAEAALNVANLALFRDVTKAVAFYRKALTRDERAETARLLGGALILAGDITSAKCAFADSMRIARLSSDTPGQYAAQLHLGDVDMRLGKLSGAVDSYAVGLQIAEAAAVRDPANTRWQRDLSVSHIKIGDVMVAQGDATEALIAYFRGREVAEALAARDPANVQWQRDLSVSYIKTGDLLLAMGNVPGALAAYRQDLEIAEALAVRDPANIEWQRDLSVSYNNVGDMMMAQGDGPGALVAHDKGLVIRQVLAVRDPANTLWQRDLSVSHNKMGDVLMGSGDGRGALVAYLKGLVIRQTLAARDPANSEWQRDLLVSHNKIGDVLLAQDDGHGALVAYRKGLEIAEVLTARDSANAEWQRDLSVSENKIGDILAAQGDGRGALTAYRMALAIREALVARDPVNTEWLRDLSVSHNKIGDVLVVQGDGRGALAAYLKGLTLRETLAAFDPRNAQWQSDIAVSCAKVGALAETLAPDIGRIYLMAGRDILRKLQSEGRLNPRADRIQWFDEKLGPLRSNT